MADDIDDRLESRRAAAVLDQQRGRARLVHRPLGRVDPSGDPSDGRAERASADTVATQPTAEWLRPDGVDVRGLSHRYHGQTGDWIQALGGIELQVSAGSFVAILGPSGCGKTTLLRIMSGLLPPSAGEVRLAGECPALARQRRRIGWLAQEDGLLPWLTVADNVRLPLRLAHAPGSGAELEQLRRVGLDGQARLYPHELSGGMRQRVALARALVARPAFLLLDEPFAHLDELTRERLGDMLLDLRAEAAASPPTTILVTHSVLEAVRLADRIIVLSPRPGRIVADVIVALEWPARPARPAEIVGLDRRRHQDEIVGLDRRRHEDEIVGSGRSRREDQPGFGRLVRELKATLAPPFAGTDSVTSTAHSVTPTAAGVTPTAEGVTRASHECHAIL